MRTSLLVIGLLPAIALLTSSLRAQDPATPVAPEGAASFSSKLNVATVEAQLAALEADSGIEDAVRELVRGKYAQAIEKLKAARQNSDREAIFRDAVQSAPGQTAEIQQQVATLPPVKDAGKALSEGSVEHLRGERESRRAALADLENRHGETIVALAEVNSRPVELAAQLPVTRSEFAEVETRLAALPADPGTPQQAAERVLAEGEREALASKIEMLVQERLSQPAREKLLAARRDLFGRQLENGRALLAEIESALKQQLKTDADRVSERVKELVGAIGEGDEELEQLVAELRDLAEDLQDSAAQLKRVDEEHGALSAKSSELIREFDRLKEQVGLGGLKGSFAQVLVEQRRRLPNPRGFSRSFKARAVSLREVRLAGFRIDDKIRKQGALETKFADGRSHVGTQLVTMRREALEKLGANNLNLIRAIARLDSDERSYRDKIVEFRDFLGEELFWKRSSPPVGPSSLKNIPAAANWLFEAARWREGGRALKGVPDYHPLLSASVMLVVLLLLAARRRIIAAIVKTGQRPRQISTDRYIHTTKAVLGTALLALPVPLAIGFLAWAIPQDPEASDWVRGLAKGLEWSSFMIGGVWFLRGSCRRGGLGIVHLGWDERFAAKQRDALRGLFLVYLPSLLLVSSTLFEDSSQTFDSIGRFVFNLAHLWMSFVLWKALRLSDGLLSRLIGEDPNRFIVRCRFLWYPMLFLFPLALVVLASLGYVLTALALSLAFVVSLGLLAAGSIIYGLVLRWFMIKERRLALAEAVEERRMRRMRREAEEIPEGQLGEIISPEAEEAELDLASIGKQTRRLLRLLTGVGVTVAIYLLWTATLPVDEALNQATIGGWITIFGLAQAVLVAAIFTTVVRDLPGLLELAGLRATVKDPGTRYAVATICQYAVIVVGLSLLSKILHLDWTQFGWMVAALSVGLGFGLQEIVANFVCGIILLFERPIRVGDFVTVDGVSGTVTRIRMRATAITNRDRKEFIVPNKQFVTGTLMNWTLTNNVSRIVITVGVAYGSDTRKARQILADIADDHPLILDDPAPFATFDAFADSTLTLTLRCYLPDVETRITTISELHTEIDERFKQAGIEIAFPQRDLHVRSIVGV